MYFDEKLKELRIKAGLTLEQLADALGISESVLDSLETGFQDPNDKELKKITEFFGVTAESLADDQPSVNALSILFANSGGMDMGPLVMAANLPGMSKDLAAKLPPSGEQPMAEMAGAAKYQEYISWDEYFMGIALFSAMRSKDPNTRVGACVVNGDNRILAIGYNGLPAGCSDDEYPWGRQGEDIDTKYPYVCHAELNAILNATASLKGCRMYTALFPCNECAKAIIQAGVREVVYLSDKYRDTPMNEASRRMLKSAGVALRQYEKTGREVKIYL